MSKVLVIADVIVEIINEYVGKFKLKIFDIIHLNLVY